MMPARTQYQKGNRMFPCRLTCVAIVSLLLLTLSAARGETAEKGDSQRLGLHENFEIRDLPNVAWEFRQKKQLAVAGPQRPV
jgi:hypothetical protein